MILQIKLDNTNIKKFDTLHSTKDGYITINSPNDKFLGRVLEDQDEDGYLFAVFPDEPSVNRILF